MTIWYRIVEWCSLSQRRLLLSCSQNFLVTCSSLCRFESSWPYFPDKFWISIVLVIDQLIFK